jgi:hypothetical protein
MTKRALILLVLLVRMAAAYGQAGSYYVNNDTLPQGITQSSSAKARVEIRSENINQRRSIRKITREFYFDSNFALDNFLYNGKVIFNASFSNYMKRVAAILLQNEPLVKGRLRFYLIASPEVNAFADHEGSIFITTGLLARLDNEAQLASILAHEAVHYVLKHALVGHIEEFKIDQGISTYETDAANYLLRKHSFNRLQETQADINGFRTYIRSGYKIGALLDAFRILRTTGQPAFAGMADSTLFTWNSIRMPRAWFDTAYVDPLAEDEEDDAYSTHPALSKRSDTLRKIICGMALDTNSGKEFLVSEQEFGELRRQSQLSLCNQYILNGDFAGALYHISAMLKKHPEDQIAWGELARCLYVYAESQQNGVSKKLLQQDTGRGVLRQTNSFLEQFRNPELSLLALLAQHDYYKRFGQAETPAYINETFSLLLVQQGFDLKKIGLRADSAQGYDSSFVRPAFVAALGPQLKEMFADSALARQYAVCQKACEKRAAGGSAEEPYISDLRNGRKLHDSTFRNCGTHLLVLDPTFYSVDIRSGSESFEQSLSEEKELEVISKLKSSARSFKDRQVTIYDWRAMSRGDIQRYDQLATLNEWYVNYHVLGEKPLWVNEWKKQKLISETGARYVADFTFMRVKDTKGTFFYIMQFYRPFIMPLWLPDAIVQMAKPKEYTYMMVRLFDIEKNKLVYTEVKAMTNVRPHPSLVGGLMHNEILKMFNGKLVRKKK